ncbi:uncharacterized protein BCR38DRAFT_445032 [Pseudomassariella vexata]|uniref:F-box domain-containing protein n=1 Tax=Pseudomassariella vexata TaxID=1141098 RepID=A0A1Y2DKA7_9PEZI|nr:uncharacterized protein BCR38DRAFT_445032 [Pseudomassariella vexata]ORY59609.1 hypothetical protein BCR38DRAFT_445032 [Pseudomassariella vexata]
MARTTQAALHLQKGKALFKSDSLVEAHREFIRAVRACPVCRSSKGDKLCDCKNLLQALENDTLKEEIKKPCSHPESNQRCSEKDHMEALNYLVAIYSSHKKLKDAQVYAQKMILIAPREPLGYLRLGKCLRLANKHEAALALYNQGSELVERKQPKHPQLSVMRAQANAVSKFLWKGDPLKEFPRELVVMTLKSFKTRDLARCLRVSKQWKSFLEGDAARSLWTVLHFQHHMTTAPIRSRLSVSQKTIAYYTKKLAQGQVTALEIDDCRAFDLSSRKLETIFRHCPHLQHLKLRGVLRKEDEWIGDILQIPMPSLKSLYLGGRAALPGWLLTGLLAASSQTLVELSIFCFHHPYQLSSPLLWPLLPNLKTLRLQGINQECWIDLDIMMRSSPDVRHLWIDNATLAKMDPSPKPNPAPWQNLEQCFIGGDVTFGHIDILPPLSSHMTDLVVENNHIERYKVDPNTFNPAAMIPPGLSPLTAANLISHKMDGGSLPYPPMLMLRRLCLKSLRTALSGPDLISLIQPSLHSGTLEELIIHPFPWELMRTGKELAWLANDSVRVLSVTGLTGDPSYSFHEQDDMILRFVDLFKGLHTLDIGKETISVSTIKQFILHNGVRRIYHQWGWAYREAQNALEGAGIKVRTASSRSAVSPGSGPDEAEAEVMIIDGVLDTPSNHPERLCNLEPKRSRLHDWTI